MPIVHITVTKPLTVEVKSDLMEYVAQQICSNTTTLPKTFISTSMRWNAKTSVSWRRPC